MGRSTLKPEPGTSTDTFWQPEYPVWLGADRGLSERPLAHPSKVQVTRHVRVSEPDVNPIRIRLDTGGGQGAPEWLRDRRLLLAHLQ
jgi:serine/threonine protein phosphatase 1